MLWKDPNGKILPSGIIMQKLLKPLNIDLFDLSFVEAIKCYPKERKHLTHCSKNCNQYLIKQIEILEPKIIISLGDYVTKNILDFKYRKFSEVVGKVFEIKYNNKIVKVLPIYHPSPISPLSYNSLIFQSFFIINPAFFKKSGFLYKKVRLKVDFFITF